MRIINAKCWVDWETEKGLRRTAQISFNVSFQKKKMFSHVTGSLEARLHQRPRFIPALHSNGLNVCSFHSHVRFRHHMYLLSPGAGKGPFPPHVGLFKKVSCVLEASHPQPPGDWLDPHDMPVPIPGSDKGNGTNMPRYFHSGFVQGAVAQQ